MVLYYADIGWVEQVGVIQKFNDRLAWGNSNPARPKGHPSFPTITNIIHLIKIVIILALKPHKAKHHKYDPNPEQIYNARHISSNKRNHNLFTISHACTLGRMYYWNIITQHSIMPISKSRGRDSSRRYQGRETVVIRGWGGAGGDFVGDYRVG